MSCTAAALVPAGDALGLTPQLLMLQHGGGGSLWEGTQRFRGAGGTDKSLAMTPAW